MGREEYRPAFEKIGTGVLPSPRPHLMGGADAPVGAAQFAANALPFGAGIADKVNKFVAQKKQSISAPETPKKQIGAAWRVTSLAPACWAL